MEYLKKQFVAGVSGASLKTAYYAKDGNNLHIISQSLTGTNEWNYTFQTGTSTLVDAIISGATASSKEEMQPYISSIQTVLSGL